MARVRDLWYAADRRKTARHPDMGGNRDAKRWLAVWVTPDGKEASKAFARQADAARYAKRMEADAERGEYIDPGAGRELCGPLFRKRLEQRGKIGARSRKIYEYVLARHVDPVFAARTIRSVKPSEIVDWMQGPLFAPCSLSVQVQAFGLVRGGFDLAVADRLLRENPARSPIVHAPKAGDTKPRKVWDTGTVWKVIGEHPDRYRLVPVVEAGLGLREGCAFGLAVEDVDFAAGTVAIRRQVVRHEGRMYFKLPKGERERTVPLPLGVAAAVRAHIAEYPPVAVMLPWLGENGTVAAEPVTARLLFVRDGPRTHGQPVSATTYISQVWYPALSRAGVGPAPEEGPRGCLRYKSAGRENGMHVLRHFYESMLDDGGVSLAGMMEFMGHSRKGKVITVAVYGNVTAETFQRARDAVDERLFRLRPAGSGGTVTELRRIS